MRPKYTFIVASSFCMSLLLGCETSPQAQNTGIDTGNSVSRTSSPTESATGADPGNTIYYSSIINPDDANLHHKAFFRLVQARASQAAGLTRLFNVMRESYSQRVRDDESIRRRDVELFNDLLMAGGKAASCEFSLMRWGHEKLHSIDVKTIYTEHIRNSLVELEELESRMPDLVRRYYVVMDVPEDRIHRLDGRTIFENVK